MKRVIRLPIETGVDRGHKGYTRAAGRTPEGMVRRQGTARARGPDVHFRIAAGIQQLHGIRQNHQPPGKRGHIRQKIEAVMEVTPGEQTTEVFVSAAVLCQKNRPGSGARVRELRTDNGPDAGAAGGGHECHEPAEIVCVGQGQPVVAKIRGMTAEIVHAGRTPPERIG